MSRGQEQHPLRLTTAERNFILVCRHVKFGKIKYVEIINGEPIKMIEVERMIRLDLTENIITTIMKIQKKPPQDGGNE